MTDHLSHSETSPPRVNQTIRTDTDRVKELTYALFRSNIDFKEAARSCGDPKCNGDCRYIETIRRIVREVDGGIL